MNEAKPASGCTGPSDCSDHNESWKRHFIVPIAKEMKNRGVGYMAIIIRDDGKASFVLEPNAGVSSSGDEPEYAPRECSAFIVHDLSGSVPDRQCDTRKQAEDWVQLVTEGNHNARLIIRQNAPADQTAVAGMVRRDVRLSVDRPWSEYPVGTRAYACNGGWWERVERGWKPNSSKDVFPTPGGDAVGKCIELPNAPHEPASKGGMDT
jgi:hypothetical protein